MQRFRCKLYRTAGDRRRKVRRRTAVGTVAFGKLSLSFSMANMAVTCITAVSIVIFPVLKRLNRDTADHLL